MEFLDGEELRFVLKREKTIPPERVVRMLVAGRDRPRRGARDRQFVHRDLKPDNLFLVRHARGRRRPSSSTSGRVKDKTKDAKKLTVLGTTIGTPVLHGARAGAGARYARRAGRRVRARGDHLRVHQRHRALRRDERPVDPPRDPDEGSRRRRASPGRSRSTRRPPRSTTSSKWRSRRTRTSGRRPSAPWPTRSGARTGSRAITSEWAVTSQAELAAEDRVGAAPRGPWMSPPIPSRRPIRSRRRRPAGWRRAVRLRLPLRRAGWMRRFKRRVKRSTKNRRERGCPRRALPG